MAEWLRRTLDQEVGVSNPELDSNLLPLFLVSGWWAGSSSLSNETDNQGPRCYRHISEMVLKLAFYD